MPDNGKEVKVMTNKQVVVARCWGLACLMFYAVGGCSETNSADEEFHAEGETCQRNYSKQIMKELDVIERDIDMVVREVLKDNLFDCFITQAKLLAALQQKEANVENVGIKVNVIRSLERDSDKWFEDIVSIQKQLVVLKYREDVKEYLQNDQAIAAQISYLEKKIPLVMELIRRKRNHFRFLAEHLDGCHDNEYPRFEDAKLASEDKVLEDLFRKSKDDVLNLLIEDVILEK